MAVSVIPATGRTELEDGTRSGVHLKRLHAHFGVCTGPMVMLKPSVGGLGAIILMLRPISNCRVPGISGV